MKEVWITLAWSLKVSQNSIYLEEIVKHAGYTVFKINLQNCSWRNDLSNRWFIKKTDIQPTAKMKMKGNEKKGKEKIA